MEVNRRRGIGQSTNLLGRPTEWLASCAFNDDPVPLHISGVREMNRSLFDMLAQAGDLADAGEAFTCYMMAMFGIDPEQREGAGLRRRTKALSLVLSAIDRGLGFRQQRPGRRGAQRLGRKPVWHRPCLP